MWKRQDYVDSKMIRGSQELEKREESIGETRRISRATKVFCIIRNDGNALKHFSKLTVCTRVNST